MWVQVVIQNAQRTHATIMRMNYPVFSVFSFPKFLHYVKRRKIPELGFFRLDRYCGWHLFPPLSKLLHSFPKHGVRLIWFSFDNFVAQNFLNTYSCLFLRKILYYSSIIPHVCIKSLLPFDNIIAHSHITPLETNRWWSAIRRNKTHSHRTCKAQVHIATVLWCTTYHENESYIKTILNMFSLQKVFI